MNTINYQNLKFLLKDLYKINKTKNEEIVNHINDALMD